MKVTIDVNASMQSDEKLEEVFGPDPGLTREQLADWCKAQIVEEWHEWIDLVRSDVYVEVTIDDGDWNVYAPPDPDAVSPNPTTPTSNEETP